MSQTPDSDAQNPSWQESLDLHASPNGDAFSEGAQPASEPASQVSTIVAEDQPPGGADLSSEQLPPAPASPPRQRGKDTTIIASILAILFIVGGTLLGTTTFNNYQGTLRANAAATAQVAGATVTAQAQAQATVQAQATATMVASTYPFSNNLVIDDPLVDNTRGLGWDNDQTIGCFFSNGSYHVLQSKASFYNTCAALNTNLSDFTFQADMVINRGGDGASGGLIFRADENHSKYYRLSVDNNGNYFILVIVDRTGTNGHARTLKTGTIAQFTAGLGQKNTLGIVARGIHFSFYVNQQLVTSFDDNTYNSGQIGFDVDYGSSPTEVLFTNAKVWNLAGGGTGGS